ncbi:hypothetical protein [Microbacterium sp. GXF7504]
MRAGPDRPDDGEEGRDQPRCEEDDPDEDAGVPGDEQRGGQPERRRSGEHGACDEDDRSAGEPDGTESARLARARSECRHGARPARATGGPEGREHGDDDARDERESDREGRDDEAAVRDRDPDGTCELAKPHRATDMRNELEMRSIPMTRAAAETPTSTVWSISTLAAAASALAAARSREDAT